MSTLIHPAIHPAGRGTNVVSVRQGADADALSVMASAVCTFAGTSSFRITYADCLDEIEFCCAQARAAVGRRRFQAALGLLLTAAQLCRHLLAATPQPPEAARVLIEEKLRAVEVQRATYEELADSMSRPFLSRRQ